MTTKVSDLRPILNIAGVQPSSDKTALSTKHWTLSDKIRFVNGMPQKIGGWNLSTFQNENVAVGKMRTVYSAILNGVPLTVLGTEKRLHSLSGSVLTNITPLKVSTIAIANAIDTHYATLAGNPIAVVSGSSDIIVTDSEAALFSEGDSYTLAGATDTGGITAGQINNTLIVRDIGVNLITLTTAGTATSTAAGGGSSVVRSSGLLTITKNAHAQLDGSRVKVTLAATTGGVTAGQINLEFVIRNITTNTFDVMTAGLATSAVSNGGGAGSLYQEEIAKGLAQASFGIGYGMGLYGVGLYGVSKVSTAGQLFPRTWFCDRYDESVIATAGNQTGVYSWDGAIAAAPVLIANAPTAVNYAFISNSILVTFGAGGVPNKIFSSDQRNITQWTASSTNQVYEKNQGDAGRLISHAQALGMNLIFTENKCYTMQYVGADTANTGGVIWKIKLKDASIGIIAPMARCVANDVVFWQGADNFYMWAGGEIKIIPSNTQADATILRHVYDDINISQKLTCFAWYNRRFNEVWFHYPSANSDNPNRLARVNLTDMSWTPDTLDRLAAEYPDTVLDIPRLSSALGVNSVLYQHEVGTDDNGAAMPFSITGSKLDSGRDTVNIAAVIPDSTQTGNITAHIDSWLFPQSATKMYDVSHTITATTDRITTQQLNGRIRQYTFSGNAVGQKWQMGLWAEQLQKGASN